MIQSFLADRERCLDHETVAIVDCTRGEDTVNVVHRGDNSCEVGDFLFFVVCFFVCATRKEECCVFKHLEFG